MARKGCCGGGISRSSDVDGRRSTSGVHVVGHDSPSAVRSDSDGLDTFKVVVVGDSSVGKTSLLARLALMAGEDREDHCAILTSSLTHPQPRTSDHPADSVDNDARSKGGDAGGDRGAGGGGDTASGGIARNRGEREGEAGDHPVAQGSAVRSGCTSSGAPAVPPLPGVHATVGFDFSIRCCRVSGRVVRLQLWDTAGQERFRTIVRSHFRKASAAIVVFDASAGGTDAGEEQESRMDAVRYWHAMVAEQCPGAGVVVVGNKCDVQGNFAGGRGAALWEELCAELGAEGVVWASAKTGEGVKAVFRNCALEAIKRPIIKNISGDFHATNVVDLDTDTPY